MAAPLSHPRANATTPVAAIHLTCQGVCR